MNTLIIFLFNIILPSMFFTSDPPRVEQATSQPEELGKVNWLRDFNRGLERAEAEKRPVFLLFQEVPGCATCRNYGHHVLSHPLIVEAIESLFVPVAIYNNKGGDDASVLAYYAEPSWNNPVVRIVDEDRRNIVPRVSGNYSQLGVVKAMKTALEKQHLPVPIYLTLLEEELEAEETGTETAILSMYCFWTGEKNLGVLDGVIETQPGFMKGKEVVKVEYNPHVLSYEEVIKQAKSVNCASHVFTENESQQTVARQIVGIPAISPQSSFRPDRDPKFYLSKTHYRFVPMTQIQATKANSLVGRQRLPDEVLSPRQRKLAEYIRTHPERKWKFAINIEIEDAWENAEKIKNGILR